MIDLSKLLTYFEDLKKAIDVIYPQNLTMDELVNEHYVDLSEFKHPKWVEAHFPLILIYHKEKAGKLRNSKSINVMFQNHNNILTQLVVSADSFGLCHRKNTHKGFSNIIGAVSVNKEETKFFYGDKQKPKKFKNFTELLILDQEDLRFKAFCEVLSENYKCDATGQLRLL